MVDDGDSRKIDLKLVTKCMISSNIYILSLLTYMYILWNYITLSSVSRYDKISFIVTKFTVTYACMYLCVQHLTLNFTTSAKTKQERKKD